MKAFKYFIFLILASLIVLAAITVKSSIGGNLNRLGDTLKKEIIIIKDNDTVRYNDFSLPQNLSKLKIHIDSIMKEVHCMPGVNIDSIMESVNIVMDSARFNFHFNFDSLNTQIGQQLAELDLHLDSLDFALDSLDMRLDMPDIRIEMEDNDFDKDDNNCDTIAAHKGHYKFFGDNNFSREELKSFLKEFKPFDEEKFKEMFNNLHAEIEANIKLNMTNMDGIKDLQKKIKIKIKNNCDNIKSKINRELEEKNKEE